MTPDEIGQSLHNRATRGEILTLDEQEQLRCWYAELDRVEMAQLNAAQRTSRLSELQALVQRASAQVVVQSRRIEEITAENAKLRRKSLRCSICYRPNSPGNRHDRRARGCRTRPRPSTLCVRVLWCD